MDSIKIVQPYIRARLAAYCRDMDTSEIGKLIHSTGMKQAEIAAALDVNVSTVRRWAAGGSRPSEEHIAELQKLAGGVKPLRLLNRGPLPAKALAEVPSDALIQELARRSRGGTLRDARAGELDAPRTLRAVAFRDVEDDG
jgi:transcriptional regulator with XRE-family HTH domain